MHVVQRHSGVQGGGDERVPQGVRADVLGDPRAAGDPADYSRGAVAVESLPVDCGEERSFGALADGQVDGAGGARGERDGDDLAALAGDDQGAVAALQAQVLDIGARGLRDPQPVEGEQGDQRALGGRPESAATRSAPSSLRSRAVACDS